MFGLGALGFKAARTLSPGEASGAVQGAAVTAGLASGIVVGTTVGTEHGWRPVEGIVAGDLVMTFDGGLQRVVSVQRGRLWTAAHGCPRHLWPLLVAAGTLGNTAEVIVLPEQAVMIESDSAEQETGDPFALIPATALAGLEGVTPMTPPHDLDVVILHFAADQIVYVGHGALFHCPAAQAPLDLSRIMDDAELSPYAVLPVDRAARLLSAAAAPHLA